MRKIYLSICLTGALALSGQEWVSKLQDPHANFYELRDEFNKYWSTHDNTEKGKGYKAFKRWEHFAEKRVYPSGDLGQLSLTAKNFEEFLNDYNARKSTGKLLGNPAQLASATWTAIGPMGPISGSAGAQLLKSGRLNFITIDPSNSNNLWVGAPAGGLWQSTNGGTSWTTNTDFLTVTGCTDLAIDPTNTSVMYLATGDGDGGDTRSIGVLKSTNGGSTWNATGLSSSVLNYLLIHRLIINPSNTQILLAATTNGIYRTTNGGTNWTLVISGNTYDMEFKPGDPNTVYACGSSFMISTNGGANFSVVSNGIPTSGVNRMAIAVTPADPAYVYVIASSSSNSGMQGFYRSIVSGTVFSQMTTTLNLLGYATLGNDVGGQGWYDLCIAASPLNRDEVVVGGVNVWQTTNGGSSWTLYGHWTGNGAPFTHADQHDLEYSSSGTLYVTNDGTVYRRTTTGWMEICGSINISQIYRMGMSSLTANRWITGHQDNGSSIWNGVSYNACLGGDGMDCFFDRTSNNNVFGEYQNGGVQKSSNGGANWSSCNTGLSGTAPWLTVWKQDPVNASVLYCGRTDLFVSTNMASSWTQLAAIPGTGTIREFAIAPSNNQVIYVLKSSGVYKTTNAGGSWSNITGTLPIASALPEYVIVDPLNANCAWIVFSGYSNGNKVFMTSNGGTNWSNISYNLPNLPANCILYQNNTQDLIYVGMDVGVYYKDSLSSGWTLYNTGLPNVPISELEISPATPGLLHAATFGRGVWVASVYAPNVPVSNFSVTTGPKCVGSSITFTDMSTNGATGWIWNITPTAGVISSSLSVANPTVQFLVPGTYTVNMQASNGLGNGNVKTQTVSITALPSLTISPNPSSACRGAAGGFTASGAGTYTWSNGGGSQAYAAFIPTTTTVYSVSGSSNGCSSMATATLNIVTASVNIAGPSSVCAGSSANLLANGAISYTWNTSAVAPFITVSPSVTTVYSVTGSSAIGCTATAQALVYVNPLPQINAGTQQELICPDQSALLEAVGALSYTWMPGNLNQSSVSVTPGQTTQYTVTGVDVNGCQNVAFVDVTVSTCESITEDGQALFSVFPNPAHHSLSIRSESSSRASFFMYDAAGKIAISGTAVFHSKTATVNIASLPAGVYFFKVVDENGRGTSARVIKE